jgi:hypothetical protein
MGVMADEGARRATYRASRRPPGDKRTRYVVPDHGGAAVGTAPSGDGQLLARADPIALNLFAQLRAQPVETQRAVLLAARARTATRGASTPRTLVSMFALEACLHDSGSCSKPAYATWRLQQERPQEWPSANFIARTFTSWLKAEAAIGQAVVVDPRIGQVITRGVRYTRTDLLEGLREWFASNPAELRQWRYVAWARDRNRRTDRRRESYCTNQEPFIREFGSWRGALLEAGRAAADIDSNVRGRIGAHELYSEANVLKHLRRAAALLKGDAALTMNAYARYRKRAIADAVAKGDLIIIPSERSAIARFETWANALHAAGLIDTDRRDKRNTHRTDPFSDDELLDALGQFIAASPRSSPSAYSAWRTAEQDHTGQRLPCAQTISQRLGGWARARASARQRRQEKKLP